MKRFIQWSITHAILGACLWFGIVEGVQGARNVGLVMVWIFIACSLVIGGRRMVEEAAKKPGIAPTVPPWFNVSLDLAVSGFLIWHGLIFTGVAYLLHIGLAYAALERIKKRRAELAAQPEA